MDIPSLARGARRRRIMGALGLCPLVLSCLQRAMRWDGQRSRAERAVPVFADTRPRQSVESPGRHAVVMPVPLMSSSEDTGGAG